MIQTMIRAVIGVVLLVSPLVASSQQSPMDVAKHGEKVFATNCSFCHGDAGNGHNAPRLAGRGLDAQRIEKVITDGVSGTAMAPWRQLLSAADYEGVVAYVKSLNGIVDPASANASKVLSGEAVKGRDLFHDATRELSACSNCHAADGKGVSIAPPMKNVPSGAAALRTLATLQMKTAMVEGERFPGLVVTQSPDETKVYDFTTVPPVLRTFTTSAVKVTDGSAWQHVKVLRTAYSDQELEQVLGYLRAAGKP